MSLWEASDHIYQLTYLRGWQLMLWLAQTMEWWIIFLLFRRCVSLKSPKTGSKGKKVNRKKQGEDSLSTSRICCTCVLALRLCTGRWSCHGSQWPAGFHLHKHRGRVGHAGYLRADGRTALTPPTYREAHHRQLLVAIGVDRHQVSGLGIQNIPPDKQTNLDEWLRHPLNNRLKLHVPNMRHVSGWLELKNLL